MKISIPKILFGIFLLLPFYSSLNAQEQVAASGLSIETKIHYGFIARHHPEMAVFSDIHFPVFELVLSKQTIGNKPWHRIYSYPEIGISYWQCEFENSEILGHAKAIYPFIRFPLIRSNRFALNFGFGLGLGYFSNKFDRLNNYKNTAIGSHLNALINLMFEAKYNLSPRFRLFTGLSFTHFSTGAMVMPNYGINIPTANLGLSFSLKNTRTAYLKHDLPELDRSWEYLIIASFGIKEISPVDNIKYLVYNVSGDFLKPMSLKYKIGGGLDLFYDDSKVYALEQKGIYEDKVSSNFSFGLHFTYEQTLSRVSILLELGTYLYSNNNLDGNIYEKLIITYLFSPKILASVALKAHRTKADFISWGVGYKF